jgi:hypothetical protein
MVNIGIGIKASLRWCYFIDVVGIIWSTSMKVDLISISALRCRITQF